MELKQALHLLEKDKNYSGWKSLHQDSFFSYALKTLDSEQERPWQLGFYNPKTDRMVTFVVLKESIEMQPEEEIIKQPNTSIRAIDLKSDKLGFFDVIEHSLDFLNQTYPKETIIKKIAILQNLKSFGTIWNLTYISQNYNTLHLKMDPSSGKVLSHTCESLMNFVKNTTGKQQ